MATTTTTTTKSLAERQMDKATAKTTWDSDKKNWEYVTIPSENALGEVHSSIGINQHSFDAGHTYLVPPDVAGSIRERLGVYARACVRVLQPKRDYVSENQVAMGTLNQNQRAAQAIDASVISTE